MPVREYQIPTGNTRSSEHHAGRGRCANILKWNVDPEVMPAGNVDLFAFRLRGGLNFIEDAAELGSGVGSVRLQFLFEFRGDHE